MKKHILLLTASIALAACSSNQMQEMVEPELPADNIELTVRPLVSRDLAVSWEGQSRGGAAMRQEAYVHVLGNRNTVAWSDTYQHLNVNGSDGTNGPGSTNSSDTFDHDLNNLFTGSANGSDMEGNNGTGSYNHAGGNGGRKAGYSMYELSRWERFCTNGKGMDQRDWMFVTSEGLNSLPRDVISNCSQPDHSYQEYLGSWHGFCTDKTITDRQKDIVRNSVRPTDLPCPKLF